MHLSADSQRRLERNPLRILDSKGARGSSPTSHAAPTMLDLLVRDCRGALRGGLRVPRTRRDSVQGRSAASCAGSITTPARSSRSPRTRSGAQSTVCGGGRYDDLVPRWADRPTPAVGFGLGIERFLMMLDATANARLAEPRRLAGDRARCGGAGARRAAGRRAARAPASVPVTSTIGDPQDGGAVSASPSATGARSALILGDDELASGEIVVRDLVARTDRRLPLPATHGAAETLLR